LQALPGTGYALAGECSARGHALVHGLLYASWHTFCLLLLIWVGRGGCRFSRALLHYLPVLRLISLHTTDVGACIGLCECMCCPAALTLLSSCWQRLLGAPRGVAVHTSSVGTRLQPSSVLSCAIPCADMPFTWTAQSSVWSLSFCGACCACGQPCRLLCGCSTQHAGDAVAPGCGYSIAVVGVCTCSFRGITRTSCHQSIVCSAGGS
jgi:hypothetical protein